MLDSCKEYGFITPEYLITNAGQRYLWTRILEQREEILEAFIAEHECKPSECVQIVETIGDRILYRVEKKKEKKDEQTENDSGSS